MNAPKPKALAELLADFLEAEEAKHQQSFDEALKRLMDSDKAPLFIKPPCPTQTPPRPRQIDFVPVCAKKLVGNRLVRVHAHPGQPTRFYYGRVFQFEADTPEDWAVLAREHCGVKLTEPDALNALRAEVKIRASLEEAQRHALNVELAQAAYFSRQL